MSQPQPTTRPRSRRTCRGAGAARQKGLWNAVFFALEDNPDLAGGAHRRPVCPAQRRLQIDPRWPAGLAAQAPAHPRPRPAGRLAHPAAARPRRDRQRPQEDAARRYPHGAAPGAHRLYRARRDFRRRAGAHPRCRRYRARPRRAGQPERTDRCRTVLGRLRHRGHAGRAGIRPAAFRADRGRHHLSPELGIVAVHRGGQPARQRARHHRADHPATGQRPHPRAGARPRRPAAPEEHSRPDREAHLPVRRPLHAGTGSDREPPAAGKPGVLHQ